MNANKVDASSAGVHALCLVLGVSSSGYCQWLRRTTNARKIANAVMTETIRQVHRDSDEPYGMSRVLEE